MRLKSVQRFSMISSLTDLDFKSVLTLTLPAAIRSETSALDNPNKGSATAMEGVFATPFASETFTVLSIMVTAIRS